MLLGTVLLLFQAAFSFSAAGMAAASSALDTSPKESATGKVIMLVVDALPVADFVSPEWTNLRELAANGVIGLMSARTTASSTFAAAASHATIGAGARSPAGTLSGYAFDTGSYHNGMPVVELFSGLTGYDVHDSAVLVLGLPQLKAAASLQREGARPGALGQAIRARGGRVAIIGNADVPDATSGSVRLWSESAASNWGAQELPGGVKFMTLRRHGALIAMDDVGRIPLGTVGPGVLTYDSDWPFAVRTDYDVVWDMFATLVELADFVVVELGDFARLDILSDWLSPEQISTLRRRAIRRIDEFVGRLADWPPAAGATVVVVSPSPPSDALRRNFLLTPIVWTRTAPAVEQLDSPYGSSSVPQGPSLATSRTTRRGGIVTNTDLAASVLAAMYPDDGLSLRAIKATVPSQLFSDLPRTVKIPEDHWETVAMLFERATFTHSLRVPVVRTFIQAAIAIFVAWVSWMIYSQVTATSPRPTRAVWRWLMLLLSATPLGMLLLPILPVSSWTASAVVLALLIGMLAATANLTSKGIKVRTMEEARRPSPGMDAFVGLSAVTAFLLVVDVWMGAPLIKSSVLGYDPIVAARFYGIGNEFMGVLIGTTLIGSTGLLDRLSSRHNVISIVFVAYAVVCVTLAAPTLGANVGGTVAAVVGFGYTGLLLLRKRVTWATALLIGGAVCGVLTAAAAFELMFRSGQLSHLGQTVQLVQEHGVWPLLDIVTRKLSMNAKLLRWTIWAQVFIVSLGASVWALYRPAATIRRIEREHPMLLQGIRGAVIAAFVALIANDSGVVAAATMMIPVTATLMYLVAMQRT